VTLQAIARHFGFPKSSTLALMGTLVDRGYVERDTADRYRLREPLRARWAVGDLGHLLVAAHAPMAALRQKTRETISLGVLTPEREVRVIVRFTSDQEVRYEADASQVRPAYCTAMGRVLLAQLPPADLDAYLALAPFPSLTPSTVTRATPLRQIVRQVRKEGLATVLEEFAVGGSGAAVPVCGPSGHALAALNLATVAPRFQAMQAWLVEELQQTAQLISNRLGASTPRVASSTDSP
jgi:DNA-binding IclR family transcriptional regulator